MKKFLSGYTKKEWAWILQDWADSVFSLMITAASFPIFYKAVTDSVGMAPATSTAYLGYANSLSTIVVAVMSPFLGTSADYKGVRGPLFTFGTLLGVGSVLAMIFAGPNAWLYLLVVYTLSAIGFSLSNVFYDSSIMDVTTEQRLDMVSSAGYAYGYIGSVFAFLIFFALQLSGWLSSRDLVNVGFLITAIWWFVFTVPYWRHVKQVSYIEHHDGLVKSTLRSLKETVGELKHYPTILWFLVGYFLYIDGVGTIIKMATSVGSDLGLPANQLIIILLVVQVVAFPSSLAYGALAKRFGSRTLLFVGIGTYVVICVFALGLSGFRDFLILAILVGTAQGGIQALSRSYFGQLIPKQKTNQFFGFYNIFGKFSSVLGTTILALVAQMTGDSLKGLFAIIIQFLLGAYCLYRAKPRNNSV